jgi:hypothetical protein
MFKKIAIGSLILIAGAVFTAFAANRFNAADEASQTLPVEQVSSTEAIPEHCQPANCSPEKAAACTYGKEASATAATGSNDCPVTKDCPPAKCNPETQSEKVTL